MARHFKLIGELFRDNTSAVLQSRFVPRIGASEIRFDVVDQTLNMRLPVWIEIGTLEEISCGLAAEY